MNDGKAPLNDVKDSDVAFDTQTPSGYVYLGQFIDHDMTMDRTPLSGQKQDAQGDDELRHPLLRPRQSSTARARPTAPSSTTPRGPATCC